MKDDMPREDPNYSSMLNIDPFEKINTNKMARDLHLRELGEESAKQELPSLDSTYLDSTEEKIVGVIENSQTSARQRCMSEIKTYGERLSKLNFREQLGAIDSEIRKKRSEFDQQVEKATRELVPEQEDLKNKQNDLEQFKEDNSLKRRAHPYDLPWKVLSLGIIAVLFLIETIGNTSFLAKGNELGLLGAYTEAIVISFVNLGIAFLLGRLAKNVVHIHWNRKFVGFFVAMVFITFAILFNLMVSHYREITGTALDEGGQLAIAAFGENPWGLKDFQSWILFFMGFLFAIISFIDGLFWDDIYPGYGEYARLSKDQEEHYKEKYEEHEKELKNTFDVAVENLGKIKQKIVGYGEEHDSILDGHRRFIKSFEDHLGHLEHAGNSLLNTYRAANRDMRDGEAPERFKIPWKMVRMPIDTSLPKAVMTREEVSKIIDEGETKVDKGINDLQKKYDESRRELRRLSPHRILTE